MDVHRVHLNHLATNHDTYKNSGAQTHSKAAGIRETGGQDGTETHRAAKRTVSRSAPNKTNYREEAEAAGFALT